MSIIEISIMSVFIGCVVIWSIKVFHELKQTDKELKRSEKALEKSKEVLRKLEKDIYG